MQYIYSAMVLYSAGKEITEDAITAILTAAGVEGDAARVKALVASAEGVDIKEASANASVAAPAAAAAPAEEKAEAEEEKVSEDEAAAGLSALFG